ncbi:TPA: hypothetical protein ACXNQL_000165 [Stenotrophomonas maltophilia]
MSQHVIAFDQARVADSLPLATARAGKERPARHAFQLRHLQMGDVPAPVASNADRIHMFQMALLVAGSVEVENVEEACIGHCGIPGDFAHGALRIASIL